MAKTRYINTRFWNDGFISNLMPYEKLIFLYFLTNEHTNICGVYELPLKIIVSETGIPKKKIEEIIPSLCGKIVYIDGWVGIKNFAKYQNSNNSNVQAGIKDALKDIPKEIIKKINDLYIANEGLCIPHQDSSHLNLNLNSDSDLNLDLDSNSPKGATAEWNFSLFQGFKENQIEIVGEPAERQKYPRNMRRKNPDVNYWLAVGKFSQSYKFQDKSKNYIYPWRGGIKLSKLYYDVREKFEADVGPKKNLEKIADMKKVAFGKMEKVEIEN